MEKIPEDREYYYRIKAGEDNGSSLVTHFDFFVYPQTGEIKWFDPVNDKAMSLAEWRKMNK